MELHYFELSSKQSPHSMFVIADGSYIPGNTGRHVVLLSTSVANKKIQLCSEAKENTLTPKPPPPPSP